MAKDKPTRRLSKVVTDAVNKIPGDDGWWKDHAGEVYRTAAKTLVALGMSDDDVIEFLENLYRAAADCFGG